jgi:tetratricopeptide (TPR) repeat protein
MRFSRILKFLGSATILLGVTQLSAQSTNDRVQRRNGVDSGAITATTPLGVTISKGGVSSKIPAEEIRSITFDGEPAELAAARTQYGRARYDNAAELLKKVDRDKITRDEVRQELDFLTAACVGHLALAGEGDQKQAATMLGKFVSTHKSSYQIPEAIELQGHLYRAAGDFDAARKKYETLAKAPADYFKATSSLLVGQLLQDQGQHAEAIPEFESAITTAGVGTVTADVKREAIFGRATSLAATGKLVEGSNIIKQIIQQTPLDDTSGLAQGYNALGECYLAGKDNQGAREAFLHVDLLFNTDPKEHARSLYQLTNLWKQLRQPTRAQDAQQRLEDEYPLTQWAGR